MKRTLVAALLALPGLALAAGTPVAQEGLWEITTKTNMPGMPMQMPAHTMQHCFSKEDFAKGDKTVPQQSEQKCEMVDKRMSGNTFSYKMVCSGRQKMTITGTVTYNKTSYQSTARTEMMLNGQTMRMNSESSARRLGDCKK